MANLIGEDRLIADEHSETMRAVFGGGKSKNFCPIAAAESGDPPRKLVRKAKEIGKRNVLAEGHEVDFVVAPDAGSIGSDNKGGVEVVPLFGLSIAGPADVAYDYRGVCRLSNRSERALEARIRFIERRGDSGQTITSACGFAAGDGHCGTTTGASVCGIPLMKLLHCSPARSLKPAMCCSHSPGPDHLLSPETSRFGWIKTALAVV